MFLFMMSTLLIDSRVLTMCSGLLLQGIIVDSINNHIFLYFMNTIKKKYECVIMYFFHARKNVISIVFIHHVK